MDQIKIQGMSCQHCVMAEIKALNQIGGLKDLRVDPGKGEASFENEGQVSREKISRVIAEAGFKAAS
jgi:copper chaperone